MDAADQSHQEHPAFACERCGHPVEATDLVPVCRACGAAHRYDPQRGRYVTLATSGQMWDLITLILVCGGAIGLLASDGKGFGWLLLFVGAALHYGTSIRTGVISSRFFILARPRTVNSTDSPVLFLIGLIIEGLSLALIALVGLFSL